MKIDDRIIRNQAFLGEDLFLRGLLQWLFLGIRMKDFDGLDAVAGCFMSNEAKNRSSMEWFINESPELADARAAGVDLWALWANLQRPVTDRLGRHQMALDMKRKLQNAKKL